MKTESGEWKAGAVLWDWLIYPYHFSLRCVILILMVTETQLSKAKNLLKNAGCTDIFLFGSQATGRAHSDSDVDLGVKGLPPRLFYRMHWQLEDALDMKVDLVDFDFQRDFFELLQSMGELRKIG